MRLLSSLLDQGIALPVVQRDAWLATLDGDAARLASTLRELLAKQAAQETADLIDRPPAFGASDVESGAQASAGDAVGPYRLLHGLGHGGMGAVWLAERADGSLRRRVALKLPYMGWAPGLGERFAREREILAGLEHPNIARLYDAGIDERGRPYMALEFVEGQPLDEYCRARSLGMKDRLALLLQVAEAVAFAHSRLVVHRDLKPANILVTEEGQVRLLDFGIAKLMEGEQASETTLTQAAGRALTPDYASPEQIRGEPIGTASDVYSLGVVAYELLAQVRPYRLKRGNPVELHEAITAVEPPLASDAAGPAALKRELRGDLDAILNKALKKHPAERYATVDALAQDWRRFLQGERVLARPDTVAYRLGRLARRHRVALSVAALVAGAFVLAIGFGATALVIGALLLGLGAALWQARRASAERDRALVLASRNEAITEFLNMVLTQAARGGQGFTSDQLVARSEQLVEREFKHHPEHRATVLAMLGTSLQTLGQPQQGIRLLERAVDALRDSNDRNLIDTVVSQRAFALAWAGRVDEAKAALQAVISHASSEAEPRAEAHHYLALIAGQANDAQSAMTHANEALRWHRLSKRPSPRFEASLLASLGSACNLAGRNDEADRHYAAAIAKLDVTGQAHSPHAIALTNNWAVMSERAGDVRQSLALCERALAASAQDAPDSPKSPYLVMNRARALESMGRVDEADAGYEEAVSLGTALGNDVIRRSALVGRASVRLAREQLDPAAAFLDEADALAGANEQPAHPVAVVSCLTRARLALQRGDVETALAAFGSAVGERPPLSTTVMGLLGLSQAHRRAGRHDQALAAAQEALALADLLRGGKPASFRSGLAQLAVARAHRDRGDALSARRAAEQALEQLRACVDAGHPALAECSAILDDARADTVA